MVDNNDKFNIEDYIKSEEFYNFIYNDCCNEVHTSKIIIIPNYNEEIYRYIINFLFHYNLAYVTLEHFILKENVSKENLEDAYQMELSKVKENTDEYIYQNTLEKFQDVKTSNEEEKNLKKAKKEKQATENPYRGGGGHISSRSNRIPRIGMPKPGIRNSVPLNDHRKEVFCDIRYGKIRVHNDDVASSEKGEARKLKK